MKPEIECHFCGEPGRHYVGGGLWLCFEHLLRALRVK